MFKAKNDNAWLAFLAMIVYGIQSLAWPLHLGRDGTNYLVYYLDLLARQPAYQMIMLRRTPVAPLMFGLPLSLFGSRFTEILSALLYCLSILLIYRLGLRFDRKIGLAAALLVIFYPAYGVNFHVVASEPPATFFLILTGLLFFEAMAKPSVLKFLALGGVIVLATLSRPDSLVLLGLAAAPLLFWSKPWLERLRFASLTLGCGLILVLLWSSYNYMRYDDFTLARGADAQIPFERAFTISHIVQPENGPASAALSSLVSSELLTREPYKSYGIDLQTFLSHGSERMFGDVEALSDRSIGWDTDYSQLKKVGLEAIFAHPRQYFWDYTKSSVGMLIFNPEWSVALRSTGQTTAPLLDARGLPVPTEGELIPRSSFLPSASSPDGRALTDPNSVPLLVLNPDVRRAQADLQQKLDGYVQMLPDRDGLPGVANVLNWISRHYPPPVLWLLIGLCGLLLHPSREKSMLGLLLGACLVMIFYPMLAFGSIFPMRTRFDPFIMLFGLVGLAEIIQRLPARYKKFR